MRFVLLGGDESLLPLLTEIEANAEHRLQIAAAIDGDFAAGLLKSNPSLRRVNSWEELLNEDFDAVISTAGNEDHETGIRQFAAIGKPLLLMPYGDPTSAFVYELSLIRDDTQAVIVPLFPLRGVTAIDLVRTAIRKEQWGRVLSLQWNRLVPSDESVLPRSVLYENLIHDVDLLRSLGGEYRQVTAVISGPSVGEFAMATVTLAGEGLPSSVWTIRPVTSQAGWELVVTTEQGSVTLSGDFAAGEFPTSNAATCRVSTTGIEGSALSGPQDDRTAKSFLASLSRSAQDGDNVTVWQDLMRATEIVDAAARSVRRRRTIDLHFETTSERNQFKTQMTAIGCGLMSMTFFSVLFLLAAGALFKPHPIVMKIAQIGIVVPLVLFLLLQLLLFIARPSSTESDSSESTDAADAPIA